MKKELIALLIFCFLLISGCGEAQSPKDIKQKSGSFLQEYLSALGGLKQEKATNISGEWRGLMVCRSGNFPVSIDVNDRNDNEYAVNVTISPAIGNPNRKTPTISEHTGRVGTLQFQPASKTFFLDTERTAKIDGKRKYGLYMYGMMGPDSEDVAQIKMIETSESRSRSGCELGFIARKSAGERFQETNNRKHYTSCQ